MKGIFIQRKFSITRTALFVGGLFLMGMYIYIKKEGINVEGNPSVFLVSGMVLSLATFVAWLLNYKSYINVSMGYLRARYNFFCKIDCTLSDVEFVSAGISVINILMKSGRQHVIGNLGNSYELAAYMRKSLGSEPIRDFERHKSKINHLVSKRRKTLILCVVFCVLMFVLVFAAMFLTGMREVDEFTSVDRAVMIITAILELVCVFFAFYYANKTGKMNLPLEMLRYKTRKSIMESTPVSEDKIIMVLIDNNYTERVTLCEHPDGKKVCCIYSRLDTVKGLVDVSRATFDTVEEILPLVDSFDDITEKITKIKAE